MMLLPAIFARAEKNNCIQLCGCPVVSACPNRCGTFELGKCQPFYQCMLEANGIFGYVLPVGDFETSENITVNVYNDKYCNQLRFVDPVLYGWEGSCSSDCWGPNTSKVGARACGIECSTSSVRQWASTSSIIVAAVALYLL
jgi:hypothetical protein